MFSFLSEGDKDELFVVNEPMVFVNETKSEGKSHDNRITGTGMYQSLPIRSNVCSPFKFLIQWMSGWVWYHCFKCYSDRAARLGMK